MDFAGHNGSGAADGGFAGGRADHSEEEEEIELVFDNLDSEIAAFRAGPPAPVVTPEPAPEIAPPPPEPEIGPRGKKRPAKGKALPAPEPEPVVEAVATEAAPPIAEPAPDPVIVVAPAPPGRWVMVAVMLAAFASILSAVGVVVTARNIAVLSQAKSETAERQALLARLPALITEIEHVRDAQRVELARAAAIRSAAPVTLPDLRRELDSTRLALGKSQPAGIGPLGGVIRAGQTELVQRLEELRGDVEKLKKR